jgi:hypothetical protein
MSAFGTPRSIAGSHLKCDPCMTRFQGDRVADYPCPTCGAPLEPAGELAELVGYRRGRLDGPQPGEDRDFLEAVAIALSDSVPPAD